ncbi:toll-like receptor 3 [Chanos chanos]|uniref:Toll-like receptor 3 n=1 Tax=Chanos chanos TaxID=29144 RepID=A0A6J2WDI6_CHACN|nr:toll-like receptor 3 [Chanos chanos]
MHIMLPFSLFPLLPLGVLVLLTLSPGSTWQMRHGCKIQDSRADCSHLRLQEIPKDLPKNISSLDMSHNQLKDLNPTILALYPRLIHLDASFNSLTKLPANLCRSLPTLASLSVQHNEVHLLTPEELRSCPSLNRLDLSWNRLKLRQEPFSVLPHLTWLDVSRNKLESAQLGTHPQLSNLVTLVLSGNSISTLRKDDFYFLRNSSSFRVLGLSSLPLQMVEPGCFKSISGLRDLVLDGSKLSPQVTSRLCEELSGTAVRNLSLRNTDQDNLMNTTFKGLGGTNLTILDLSKNQIDQIAEGSFQWFPLLETLSLEENKLKKLTRGTFLGLGALKKLNLSWALVKKPAAAIDDFSFQPLAKLESLHMENTGLRKITEHTFSGLYSLRTLDLSWSSAQIRTITNRTFVSLQDSPLRMLNLSFTAIAKLDPNAFSCLSNLTKLLLGHNFISQTLTGEELQGLNRVEELYLSFNQNKITLTSSSFVHVPTLRALYLDHALTGTLDLNPSPFRPLVNLRLLNLNYNNIANINADLLAGQGQLKVLTLQHNNLARLWKNANPGGPVLFLKDVKNLSVLEMDTNGLDEIPLAGLKGLTQLQELSLSGNLLEYLQDSLFSDLHSLRVLHLQKNMITSVRREVFASAMANLSELQMDHNPFDCTCESILWFTTWLNSTSASVPGLQQGYICNTPSLYYNRSIMQFDPLSCKDMTPFQGLFVLTSTAVLLLLFTAFLWHFQGWRIQFYGSILINRTLGLKDDGSEEERFEYDAFIIHTEKDRPWVERRLLPLENEHLKFFTEYRDAIPGHSHLETIVDNLKKARKIIFVVTDMLLKDSWCRQFKAHHALHQVMEDSRDSVVLVFLQDVPDYQLSRSLLLRRGMLKSRCILHWPQHKERIPAFHQKLRVALATSNRVN